MKKFHITINGKEYEVEVREADVEDHEGGAPSGKPAEAKPAEAPKPKAAAAPKPARRNVPADFGGAVPVKAPLSGTIMSVKVSPGDEVKAGDVLLTLEAMKMENELVSPKGGTIKEIFVTAGDQVNAGEVLVTVIPA